MLVQSEISLLNALGSGSKKAQVETSTGPGTLSLRIRVSFPNAPVEIELDKVELKEFLDRTDPRLFTHP